MQEQCGVKFTGIISFFWTNFVPINSLQCRKLTGVKLTRGTHSKGTRNVYIFGAISTGVCALLFGLLDFIEDKVLFLLFSYGLRVLEGIAEVRGWWTIPVKNIVIGS